MDTCTIFSADYDFVDVSNTRDIHKYFMKKIILYKYLDLLLNKGLLCLCRVLVDHRLSISIPE